MNLLIINITFFSIITFLICIKIIFNSIFSTLDSQFLLKTMNTKIILSMGVPITIRNREGKVATIELNKREFVICRYHPNNSFYLNDTKLKGWYPKNIFKRVIYKVKNHYSKSAISHISN